VRTRNSIRGDKDVRPTLDSLTAVAQHQSACFFLYILAQHSYAQYTWQNPPLSTKSNQLNMFNYQLWWQSGLGLVELVERVEIDFIASVNFTDGWLIQQQRYMQSINIVIARSLIISSSSNNNNN